MMGYENQGYQEAHLFASREEMESLVLTDSFNGDKSHLDPLSTSLPFAEISTDDDPLISIMSVLCLWILSPQVHPQLFTKTLLSTAVAEYGVAVVIGKLEREEVEEGRATAGVLESGEVIGGDAVVLCLGPWTAEIDRLLLDLRPKLMTKMNRASAFVQYVRLRPSQSPSSTLTDEDEMFRSSLPTPLFLGRFYREET